MTGKRADNLGAVVRVGLMVHIMMVSIKMDSNMVMANFDGPIKAPMQEDSTIT